MCAGVVKLVDVLTKRCVLLHIFLAGLLRLDVKLLLQQVHVLAEQINRVRAIAKLYRLDDPLVAVLVLFEAHSQILEVSFGFVE